MKHEPDFSWLHTQIAALFDAIQVASLSRDPPPADETIPELCDIGRYLVEKLQQFESIAMFVDAPSKESRKRNSSESGTVPVRRDT